MGHSLRNLSELMPRPGFLLHFLLPATLGCGNCGAAAPQPVVDLRESLRPSPIHPLSSQSLPIHGSTTLPDGAEIRVRITTSTGITLEAKPAAAGGKFSCSYPKDFPDAPALSPCLLYVDAIAGADLLSQQAEATFIVTGSGKPGFPDLPAAFTDDFIDASGKRDSAAASWELNRTLTNRFMQSRGAKLAGIGRPDFDLAEPAGLALFRRAGTLYDFDHRDRDWSTPLGNRPARAFWQAEWNRWFGTGNDHPWDGNPANKAAENFRPYTFTNDLADLLILHGMRRGLTRAVNDNRDAMCEESLANLLALQNRSSGNLALREADGKQETYTAGAFRYGFFETGEWMTEGTGWFVNPKAGDHRRGGVFNGRAVWALGEALKVSPAGPQAKDTRDAIELALRFCLHDGISLKYTRVTPSGLPFWRQAGEHGYLTLGMLAAVSSSPNMMVALDPAKPARPLKEVTADALNALLETTNADKHWTKYPDQDAMALAALSEGALVLPNHPDTPRWKAAAIAAADGWLAARQPASERAAPCPHFGRRAGSVMTYYIGDKPEVHINLYVSGLWLHALAKTYQLTGDVRYRDRSLAMLAYLCGDNPFHARLLNETGGVYNIIRDTDGPDSKMGWDAYPESTAFFQIGLLHLFEALDSRNKSNP